MSNSEDGFTIERLMARLEEVEHANLHLKEEMAALRREQPLTHEQEQVSIQIAQSSISNNTRKSMRKRKGHSRRGLLKRGLGIAVASIGMGALLETNAGIAFARGQNGVEGPTTFNNNGGNAPAVTANSTSPSNSKVNAIKATSAGYTGIAGYTNNNSTGVSGVFGSGPSVGVAGYVQNANTSPTNGTKVGVYGTGSNGSKLGGIGVQGQSDTNTGVAGQSTSGYGVSAISNYGTALFAQSSSADAIHAIGGGVNRSGLYVEGNSGFGVFANSTSGIAVHGNSVSNTGVQGQSISGYGVYGQNTGSSGYGVAGVGPRGILGQSTSDIGVHGESSTSVGVWGQGTGSGGTGILGSAPGATTLSPGNIGIFGTGSNGSNLGLVGVEGLSDTHYGVVGQSMGSAGVAGFSSSTNYTDTGVLGTGPNGLVGQTAGATTTPPGNVGVYGTGSNGNSLSGVGVYGESDTYTGVYGYCPSGLGGTGVWGDGDYTGVNGYAYNTSGTGVYGNGPSTGITAENYSGTGLFSIGNTLAGEFSGDVNISGNLSKGGGSFKIDHPLDPANKYLYHSFVESSDMKNIYDGMVTLDEQGEAEVELPQWFDALNNEFRYQLTSIGAPGPNLYIAEEISGLRFRIAGGAPAMNVCWQVTGIRQDAWANANRIPVEQDKLASERGHYLYPKLFGHSADKSIMDARYAEMLSRIREKNLQKNHTSRAHHKRN